MITEKPYRFQIIKKHRPVIDTNGYICLYGGRGGAKSWSVAKIIIAETFKPDSNVLCAREIQKSIQQSVHKLLSDIIKKEQLSKFFKITETSITNLITNNDFVFTGIRDHTVDSIKSYEGRRILWFEEAHSATKKSLDILLPTINRNKNFKAIFTYNRQTELDQVHKLTLRPDVLSIYTGYWDNPFIEEVFIKEADLIKQEHYNDWLHIYKGEPVVQTDRAVISRELLQKAMEIEIEDDGAIEVGIDVARYGDDLSVMTKRKGHKLLDIKEFSKIDLVSLSEHIKAFVGFDKKIIIKIDDTGVGGGITDILKSDNYNVVGVNFGGTPKNKDKYPNIISEMWFEFAELLPKTSLINNTELFNELTTREWKMDSKGKRCIESKQDYKKRGYSSPDKADSLLLCFYNLEHNYTMEVSLTDGLTKDGLLY